MHNYPKRNLVVLVLLLLASQAFAFPSLLPVQGKLKGNNPMDVNASMPFTFSLYSAASGGTALWTVTKTVDINVVDATNNIGAFTTLLGENGLLDINSHADFNFLGIEIQSNGEMVPRIRLGSGSYSFYARHSLDSDLLDGRDWDAAGDVNATSVSASGFFGDGSGLTGITSSPSVDTNTIISILAKAQDTNAASICDANQVLTGNADCIDISNFYIDTVGSGGIDTTLDNNILAQNYYWSNLDGNAASICDANQVLNGSGDCIDISNFWIDTTGGSSNDTTLDSNAAAEASWLGNDHVFTGVNTFDGDSNFANIGVAEGIYANTYFGTGDWNVYNGTNYCSYDVSDGSFACGGEHTNASGGKSVAFGQWNTATGPYSASLYGFGNEATATSAFAGGNESVASQNYAIALGNYATASGESSIALGASTTATALYSVAIGHSVINSVGSSVAVGTDFNVQRDSNLSRDVGIGRNLYVGGTISGVGDANLGSLTATYFGSGAGLTGVTSSPNADTNTIIGILAKAQDTNADTACTNESEFLSGNGLCVDVNTGRYLAADINAHFVGYVGSTKDVNLASISGTAYFGDLYGSILNITGDVNFARVESNDSYFVNVSSTGDINANSISATMYFGDGSQLTGIATGSGSVDSTVDNNLLAQAYYWSNLAAQFPVVDANVDDGITLTNLTQVTTRNYSDLQNILQDTTLDSNATAAANWLGTTHSYSVDQNFSSIGISSGVYASSLLATGDTNLSSVTATMYFGDGSQLTNLPSTATVDSTLDTNNAADANWLGNNHIFTGSNTFGDVNSTSSSATSYFGNLYGAIVGITGDANFVRLETNDLYTVNVSTTGDTNANSVSGTMLFGDGSQLTNLPSATATVDSTLDTNSVADANWLGNNHIFSGTSSFTDDLNALRTETNDLYTINISSTGDINANSISATRYFGDGSQLTGISFLGGATDTTLDNNVTAQDYFWSNLAAQFPVTDGNVDNGITLTNFTQVITRNYSDLQNILQDTTLDSNNGASTSWLGKAHAFSADQNFAGLESNNVYFGNATVTGDTNVGSFTASMLFGDGSQLTGISAGGHTTDTTLDTNSAADVNWHGSQHVFTADVNFSRVQSTDVYATSIVISNDANFLEISATNYFGNLYGAIVGITGDANFARLETNDLYTVNISSTGDVNANSVSATRYFGDGSQLTGITTSGGATDTTLDNNLLAQKWFFDTLITWLPINDANVADNITVNWAGLDTYPAACSAGQFVTTVGDTLTCSQPGYTTDTTVDNNVTAQNYYWSNLANKFPVTDANVDDGITLTNLTQVTTRNYSDLQNILQDTTLDSNATAEASWLGKAHSFTEDTNFTSISATAYFGNLYGAILNITGDANFSRAETNDLYTVNISSTGDINANSVSATMFFGDGSQLTNLPSAGATTDTTIDTNQSAFDSIQVDLNAMYCQIPDSNNPSRLAYTVIADAPWSIGGVTWANLATLFPVPDANVADDITLTNITQITNRSYNDLTDLPTFLPDTTCDTNTTGCSTYFNKIDINAAFVPYIGADYDTTLGEYSITAKKFISTDANSAFGINAVALGYLTTAFGDYSFATGNTTTASGYYSTSMGSYSKASGTYSFAVGDSPVASGTASVATGVESYATATSSVAMGDAVHANGTASVAMGQTTIAGDEAGDVGAIALGYNVQALGEASVALGKNIINSDPNSVAVNDLNVTGDFNVSQSGTSNRVSIEADFNRIRLGEMMIDYNGTALVLGVG